MKKELLKGFTMLALTVALALATAAASNAQTSNRIVADIPFEFTVGGQTLPSGQGTCTTLGCTHRGAGGAGSGSPELGLGRQGGCPFAPAEPGEELGHAPD